MSKVTMKRDNTYGCYSYGTKQPLKPDFRHIDSEILINDSVETKQCSHLISSMKQTLKPEFKPISPEIEISRNQSAEMKKCSKQNSGTPRDCAMRHSLKPESKPMIPVTKIVPTSILTNNVNYGKIESHEIKAADKKFLEQKPEKHQRRETDTRLEKQTEMKPKIKWTMKELYDMNPLNSNTLEPEAMPKEVRLPNTSKPKMSELPQKKVYIGIDQRVKETSTKSEIGSLGIGRSETKSDINILPRPNAWQKQMVIEESNTKSTHRRPAFCSEPTLVPFKFDDNNSRPTKFSDSRISSISKDTSTISELKLGDLNARHFAYDGTPIIIVPTEYVDIVCLTFTHGLYGFDTESDCHTGELRIIQIYNGSIVYIFDITALVFREENMFIKFLNSKDRIKVGADIDGDVHKIRKYVQKSRLNTDLATLIKAKFNINGVIDLQSIARTLGEKLLSLEKLAAKYVDGFKANPKDLGSYIRPTDNQYIYAANDAVVSYKIYHPLVYGLPSKYWLLTNGNQPGASEYEEQNKAYHHSARDILSDNLGQPKSERKISRLCDILGIAMESESTVNTFDNNHSSHNINQTYLDICSGIAMESETNIGQIENIDKTLVDQSYLDICSSISESTFTDSAYSNNTSASVSADNSNDSGIISSEEDVPLEACIENQDELIENRVEIDMTKPDMTEIDNGVLAKIDNMLEEIMLESIELEEIEPVLLTETVSIPKSSNGKRKKKKRSPKTSVVNKVSITNKEPESVTNKIDSKVESNKIDSRQETREARKLKEKLSALRGRRTGNNSTITNIAIKNKIAESNEVDALKAEIRQLNGTMATLKSVSPAIDTQENNEGPIQINATITGKRFKKANSPYLNNLKKNTQANAVDMIRELSIKGTCDKPNCKTCEAALGNVFLSDGAAATLQQTMERIAFVESIFGDNEYYLVMRQLQESLATLTVNSVNNEKDKATVHVKKIGDDEYLFPKSHNDLITHMLEHIPHLKAKFPDITDRNIAVNIFLNSAFETGDVIYLGNPSK